MRDALCHFVPVRLWQKDEITRPILVYELGHCRDKMRKFASMCCSNSANHCVCCRAPALLTTAKRNALVINRTNFRHMEVSHGKTIFHSFKFGTIENPAPGIRCCMHFELGEQSASTEFHDQCTFHAMHLACGSVITKLFHDSA